MRKIRLAVLMGGRGEEHEVSLSSGSGVIQHVDYEKYLVRPVIISREGIWKITTAFLTEPAALDELSFEPYQVGEAIEVLRREVDLVFITLHGRLGEDGTIQGMLDIAGMTYVGSGVTASALGMHKAFFRIIAKHVGVTVPPGLVIDRTQWEEKSELLLFQVRSFGSWVVKPVSQGSSIGVFMVESFSELGEAVGEVLKLDQGVIIEKRIKGPEVTCGVLGGGRKELLPLPPTLIVPRQREFFDYFSKYTPGATLEITPAPLPEKVIKKLQEDALLMHRTLGCRGMSRSDFIYDEKEDRLYLLEINTIPGLTPTSLIPQACRAMGMSFKDLIDYLVEDSLSASDLRYNSRIFNRIG
jgi:D-alanine-D-alanine ligase